MTLERITLSRDIPTDVGTIAAGSTWPATIALDVTGWQIEMSLPREGVPSHPLSIRARSVRGGKRRLDILHTHHDYRFARDILGYGHVSALVWIGRGYRVGERQLLRWGFAHPKTEVAA